jgi:hypothetical protein
MGKLSAPLHWWLPLHVTLSDPSHQVASNSFSFIALHLKHLFLLVCILCTCHFYCQQFLRWKRMELCINFVLSNAWWTLAALQSLSVSIENDRSVPQIVLFFFFQSATNIAISTKCTSVKKKENNKLAKWAFKEITNRQVSWQYASFSQTFFLTVFHKIVSCNETHSVSNLMLLDV